MAIALLELQETAEWHAESNGGRERKVQHEYCLMKYVAFLKRDYKQSFINTSAMS
jgi:hypothetical protein